MPQARHCRWCERPIPHGAKAGRPRLFCNRSHRQRYYEWVRRWGLGMTLPQLAARDGYRCGICSGPVDIYAEGQLGPSIDHVLPVACGGETTMANVQLSHSICNTRKRARPGWTCPPVTDAPVEQPLTLFPWEW